MPKLLQLVKAGEVGKAGLGPERPIGQIIRLIDKGDKKDFQAFWLMDGLATLENLISSLKTSIGDGATKNPTQTSRVAIVRGIQLYRNTCSSCKQISEQAILGGSILTLFDSLQLCLKVSIFKFNFSIDIFDNFFFLLSFNSIQKLNRQTPYALLRHPLKYS